MLIEKELEQRIKAEIETLAALAEYQIVLSRDCDTIKGERKDATGVVAITAGYRQHDAFSLSPISMPVTISIVTRIEQDRTSAKHEAAVEAVSDWLSACHKDGERMTANLSCGKFFAGELRCDGGSGFVFDSDAGVFRETISVTIRGSEIFTA